MFKDDKGELTFFDKTEIKEVRVRKANVSRMTLTVQLLNRLVP